MQRAFWIIAIAVGVSLLGIDARAGIEEHKPCPVPVRHAATDADPGRDVRGEFALKWALAPLGLQVLTVEEAQQPNKRGDDTPPSTESVGATQGSLRAAEEPPPAAAGCQAARPGAPSFALLGLVGIVLLVRRRRHPAP